MLKDLRQNWDKLIDFEQVLPDLNFTGDYDMHVTASLISSIFKSYILV
jgi:hypothetical protein